MNDASKVLRTTSRICERSNPIILKVFLPRLSRFFPYTGEQAAADRDPLFERSNVSCNTRERRRFRPFDQTQTWVSCPNQCHLCDRFDYCIV